MSYIPQSSNDTFEDINQLIRKHLEERDWLDNSSRSLASSIVLEAAELLEHYQWSEKSVGDKEALAGELADILIYAFQFAQNEKIDISIAIKDKLQKAAIKYPAEAFKGKDPETRRKEWIASKQKHRQNKKGL